jgi:hypothetical protein
MIAFVEGNCITLLGSGAGYFSALEAEFDSARRGVAARARRADSARKTSIRSG